VIKRPSARKCLNLLRPLASACPAIFSVGVGVKVLALPTQTIPVNWVIRLPKALAINSKTKPSNSQIPLKITLVKS
jgi:hypothetical protein